MSIKDEIKSFLLQNPVYSGTLPVELTYDFPLIDSGILDSIGIFTLVVHLEKTFFVTVEITDLNEKNFGTLAMIEAFVQGKTAHL